MRSLSLATKSFQPLADSFETRRSHFGSSSVALVVLEEVLARHAVAFGQPHQPAFEADQALVDVVELLDQRLDAVLVERQRLHVGDDLVLELLVVALLRGRERLVLQPVLDVLILQPAQLLVVVGDAVEGLEHLRLELGLHRRERERVLDIVVSRRRHRRRLGGAPRHRRSPAAARLAASRRGAGVRGCGVAGRAGHRRIDRRPARLLGVGAGIGRFEVDDVAQQDLAVVQFVAPDDDRLEGERAFAQAGDHRLAAGLDALGDGDFALARQELDRAHLAQIHAHRIVGAVGRLGACVAVDRRRSRRLDELAALGSSSSASSALGLVRLFASSLSTTLMPMSLSIASMSSIWSEELPPTA